MVFPHLSGAIDKCHYALDLTVEAEKRRKEGLSHLSRKQMVQLRKMKAIDECEQIFSIHLLILVPGTFLLDMALGGY